MIDRKILIEGGVGEVKIFFDENLYVVKREDISSQITAAVLNGTLTGANLDDLDYGTIVCKYNPTRIDCFNAIKAVKKITEVIKASTPADV